MRMYETDDNAQYLEFKKLWSNYLSRKNEVVQVKTFLFRQGNRVIKPAMKY